MLFENSIRSEHSKKILEIVCNLFYAIGILLIHVKQHVQKIACIHSRFFLFYLVNRCNNFIICLDPDCKRLVFCSRHYLIFYSTIDKLLVEDL